MEVGASPAQLARWKRLFDGILGGDFEFASAYDIDALEKRVFGWSPSERSLSEQDLLRELKKHELAVAELVKKGHCDNRVAHNFRAEKLKWADEVRAGLTTIPTPLTIADKEATLRRIRGEPTLDGKAPSPRVLQFVAGVSGKLHPDVLIADVIDLPPREDK